MRTTYFLLTGFATLFEVAVSFHHQPSLSIPLRNLSSETFQCNRKVPTLLHHHNPNVSIEYCTGCRWGLRSAWLQQELLTTFNEEMGSVTLRPSKPPSPGGTFIVTLQNSIDGNDSSNTETLLWDRKAEGRFPESKELKQRVRNGIAPSKDLGHSDGNDTAPVDASNAADDGRCEECDEAELSKNNDNIPKADADSVPDSGDILNKNDVDITYCTGCKWMMRSAWISMELLSTFEEELNSVTLTPSRPPEEGGKFMVSIGDKVLWDRKEHGRFPEAKELKQMIRDEIAPSKSLGHSDVSKDTEEEESDIDEMDDDDAVEMRAFYGVL